MKDEVDAQWFILRAGLEYFDTFAYSVARDSLLGGHAKNLILQADLALRAKMCRVNNPTLPHRLIPLVGIRPSFVPVGT